jgi:hypothetical protein
MELPAPADYLGQRWLGTRTVRPWLARPRSSSAATARPRVEPVGRFVTDQDLGVAEQGCGEGEPLAHPEGEAAHPLVPDLGELERVLVDGEDADHGRVQVEGLDPGVRIASVLK